MENNASKHRMISKRILLFSILFSILIVSGFVFYLLQADHSSTKPLRKDIVPSDAYVVPWMTPSHSIQTIQSYSRYSQPWDIESVMTGSLKISANFTIELTNETRVVQSTIYLGHDSEFFYVGAALHGIYRNPTSTNPLNAHPQVFVMMLDVDNDGNLSFPESGSVLGVAVYENASLYNNYEIWNYDDLLWWYTRWTTGWEFYWPKAQPGFSDRGYAAEYDNVTGTSTILFAKLLFDSVTSSYNALQMRSGECWVMRFLLMAGYTNNGILFQDLVVSWPKEGYFPNSNDSSWWPKLAIDLSNPPATYPGVPL